VLVTNYWVLASIHLAISLSGILLSHELTKWDHGIALVVV
jgi:hypothetical protein